MHFFKIYLRIIIKKAIKLNNIYLIMNRKNIFLKLFFIAVIALAIPGFSFANTPARNLSVITGKVTAVSGNTITILNKQGDSDKTLTVDAATAKILRGNREMTISNIAVGDPLVIQGTTNGTKVTATVIRDGKMDAGKNMPKNQAPDKIQGNGQPVVAGKITVISGSAITITNVSNVTYSVDAANTKILKGKDTVALSDLKVGDSVIVQGVINGTSVTASTIINQAKVAEVKERGAGSKWMMGVFGKMGNFFSKMFGF